MNLKLILGLLGASLIIFLVGFGSFKLTRQEVAGIQVITGDKEAVVFLDGHYLDSTPLVEQKLKPKTYVVRIEPKDETLTPYETEVTLHQGALTVITWHPEKTIDKSGGVIYEMQKTKNNKTEIHFASIPDKAIIKLDGGDPDFTPLTLDNLKPGEHTYEVSLPAYETQQNSLNVKQGYRIDVMIKLAKATNLEEENETNKPTPSPQPTDKIASASGQTEPIITILSTGLYQDGQEVLRVREQPTQASSQVGVVKVGQSYVYTDKKNNWYQIKFDADKIGWVSGQYAKKKNL